MRTIDAILKTITVIFEVLTGLLLVGMVASITWLVITRQIMKNAASWAEEIALVMIVWFGLIGATFGVRERYHLRIDLIYKYFPRFMRIAIAYLTDGLIVTFGILLVIGGLDLVKLTWDQTLAATKLPAGIGYLPLPVTGILIALYGLRNMINGTLADAENKSSE